MTAEQGRGLLGATVFAGGIAIGSVDRVLVDRSEERALGLSVQLAFGGPARFLPSAAAAVEGGRVRVGSPFALLALLAPEEMRFYEERGARWAETGAAASGR